MPWYNYPYVIANMLTIFLFHDDCTGKSHLLHVSLLIRMHSETYIDWSSRESSGARAADDDSKIQRRRFR